MHVLDMHTIYMFDLGWQFDCFGPSSTDFSVALVQSDWANTNIMDALARVVNGVPTTKVRWSGNHWLLLRTD
jgi:hypothetical protein